MKEIQKKAINSTFNNNNNINKMEAILGEIV